MISENAERWNAERSRDVARQVARLLRCAVVGEVAAQKKNVGGLRDFRKHLGVGTLRRLLGVKVGHRRNAERFFLGHYLLPS